jgi:hypothetical protein
MYSSGDVYMAGYCNNSSGKTVAGCRNTAGSPTVIDDFHAASGNGSGTFSVSLTGLTADTVHHVPACAVNYSGTAYGDETTFNSGKLIEENHSF